MSAEGERIGVSYERSLFRAKGLAQIKMEFHLSSTLSRPWADGVVKAFLPQGHFSCGRCVHMAMNLGSSPRRANIKEPFREAHQNRRIHCCMEPVMHGEAMLTDNAGPLMHSHNLHCWVSKWILPKGYLWCPRPRLSMFRLSWIFPPHIVYRAVYYFNFICLTNMEYFTLSLLILFHI